MPNKIHKKLSQRHYEEDQDFTRKPTGLASVVADLEPSEAPRNLDEEWLQTLYHTSQIGVYVVVDGKFRYVNPRFQSDTGYSKEELVGKNSLDLVHPEDREQAKTNAIRMLKGERTSPYEYRAITKDGKTLWIVETVASISYQGRRAALGNFMDVTEHKRAEELIRAHIRKVEALQQVSSTLAKSLDLKSVSQIALEAILKAIEVDAGSIWLVDKEAEEVLLLAQQGLPPVLAQEVYHRPRLKLGQGLIGRVVQTRELVALEEYTENVKDLFPSVVAESGYRYFIAFPLKVEENVVGVVTVASQRRLALTPEDLETLFTLGNMGAIAMANAHLFAQIRKGRETWQQTFDSITNSVCILDKDFRLIRVNRAFANAFNKSFKELLGRHCYEVVHGTDCPVPNCPHQITLRTKRPAREELFEPNRGVYFEMSTSPLTNEKGEIIGSVHVARDITESKQMQQQVMISDRLACIGELASGIAHEINNPLTSVICLSQLLLKKELPADVREDLNIIDTGAQRAAAMVKNLLTLACTSPPHKQASQINDIIDDVLKLRAYPLAQDHIEVCRRFAPDLPEIMVDCSQMQQVFLNIIMNAEFFMTKAHKRGTLTITTEKVSNNIVRISFADDGPGIPKENLNRVFDAFFTTKEAGKGTGLGLSICHNIISEHGGKIYAKEGSAKGATFIIELPLVSPQTFPVRSSEGINTKGSSKQIDRDQPVMTNPSTEPLRTEGFPIAVKAKTTNGD